MSRKANEVQIMTRKAALLEAIEIIKTIEINPEHKEILLKKLQSCADDLPYNKWTKESIFDAFDQFIEEHHRNISVRDMDSYGLPPRCAIMREFGMTGAEFRDTYYPLEPISRIYYDPDLIAKFKEEYIRCGANTKQEFDILRNRSIPNSATILRRTGIKSWRLLLYIANIKKPVPPKEHTQFEITYHSDQLDKMQAINRFNLLPDEERTIENLQKMLERRIEHIYTA